MAGVALTPDLRHRLERLLLAHSEWWNEGGRRGLVDAALREHEIWDHVDVTGSPAEAAVHLLELAEQHGPEPYCLLLSTLRTPADPERAKEIEALERALRSQRRQRARVAWNNPPYLGLTYFNREHAPIFFGRDDEVDRLIQTLTKTEQGGRFTVVVGASGAGKSSLVRAGLWARLEAGEVRELPGSQEWLVTAMTPLAMDTPAQSLQAALNQTLERQGRSPVKIGDRPLAEVAAELLPGGEARWLLILDQMEELFSLGAAGAVFLDRLLEATQIQQAQRSGARCQVVATLRADFFHHCLQHAPLKRAVSREGGQFLLGPPGRLALEQMVRGPIEEVTLPKRWTLDAALAPMMAADAERHPGGLALMAFALRELYERCREKRRLDAEVYRSEAFGRLSGAIARRADVTLAALGEGAGKALERVFARLVRVSYEDAPTRRRERRSAWAGDADAEALMDAFVKARLLVADNEAGAVRDPVIEVAHDALLGEWPRLAGWIEQRREAFRLAERVRTEAAAWKVDGPKWQHLRPWQAELIDEYRTILADAGLLSVLLCDPQVALMLTPEREWLVAELKNLGTSHFRRRDIGRRLAEIGDPRPGVGVIDGLPDIMWQSIPGGELSREFGRRKVKPFQMSAYPVTFCQFRSFLRSNDGFDNERWWVGLTREGRDVAWESPLANHPVIFVSWFEATAFCRWLTARVGREIRLPNEYEWQWAAQSAEKDFKYPWGLAWREGVANTDESDIRRATAVGMYPEGASRQGVADLAGNVWEWCQGEEGPGVGRAPGEVRHTLCGGSWRRGNSGALASARSLLPPDVRDDAFGFRVLCAPPFAEHDAV